MIVYKSCFLPAVFKPIVLIPKKILTTVLLIGSIQKCGEEFSRSMHMHRLDSVLNMDCTVLLYCYRVLWMVLLLRALNDVCWPYYSTR